MRPVCRGVSPQIQEFVPYGTAKEHLLGRLGNYCSFCERRVEVSLAVEHIQAKSIPAYAALEGTWTNFLLACANCNSSKSTKIVILADVLLPDRDNTFHAYEYLTDGTVVVRAGLTPPQAAAAAATLTLVGLDKGIHTALDDNDTQIVIDRVSKRLEVWLQASDTKKDLDAATPEAKAGVRNVALRLAKASGCFSIWMQVFAGDATFLASLIAAYPGTAASGCFDPATGASIAPHPNSDALLSGSKV
jgi:uncharacterized protein (TIGR02646 family)